jgi:pimeloyl-ACP methyl ester carboxylesterase
MSDAIDQQRRNFMSHAATGMAMAGLATLGTGFSGSAIASGRPVTTTPLSTTPPPSAFGELRRVRAGPLDVGYFELGSPDGPPVLLLHGFPYDVHSYVEVAPLLASRGCRVIVPYLRGHGPTRFVDRDEPRSGQQAAIGVDVIDLMNALHIPRAVLAGYDWGGRAACVAAALWPERCDGLVSVNSYLVQNLAKAMEPLPAKVEWGLWYQHYFQTARGEAGLAAHRRDIARILWKNNSPTWSFDDATFERSAAAFDNPDYVAVVVHSYRHRMALAEGFPRYADVERRLATQPAIAVPTITIDGDADGVVPSTDGTSGASHFTGNRSHRVFPNVGHNVPQEAPQAFADAVWNLVSARRPSP